jgi:hypothetical protein
MRFNPSNAEMTEGETNLCTFKLAPAVGANSFTSTPTLECTGLTFGTVTASGNQFRVLVSGGEADRDYIVKVTAPLSSGETKVGAIRLEWKAAGYDARSGTV